MMSGNQANKLRLAVLGMGFGAFRLLKSIDTSLYDVTVVSPRNYFLFTPLLASTAVGTIEFRSIVEPIRAARPGIRYFQASCRSLNAADKTMLCQGESGGEPFELSYDILVIAVGAATATFGIPGVQENCLFLKDIPDARAIRSRIVSCFERANEPGVSDDEKRTHLRFAVIGGGPTGIEFAAELHDLITQDLKSAFKALMPFVEIAVLEASEKILSTFDATLSAYTMKAFRRQNIHIRTGSYVTEVKKGLIILRDSSVVEAGLILWSAGIAATPFVESLPFPKYHAQLITDAFLAVPEAAGVYAIGDCASIQGAHFAATGQLAQQQGRYLAHAFNRRAKGKAVKPFHFLNLGMLAYVGSGRALMDAPGVKGRGFFAWLLWRSIYLTKLVSLRNKMSVLFDWLRTFLFGRDISKF